MKRILFLIFVLLLILCGAGKLFNDGLPYHGILFLMFGFTWVVYKLSIIIGEKT